MLMFCCFVDGYFNGDFYCYGLVLFFWSCVNVMAMCYCCGVVLLLWCYFTLMMKCYSYFILFLL